MNRMIIIAEVKNNISILHLIENGSLSKIGIRKVKDATPNKILATGLECTKYEFIDTGTNMCLVMKKKNIDRATQAAIYATKDFRNN